MEPHFDNEIRNLYDALELVSSSITDVALAILPAEERSRAKVVGV
jgi:hypothetical protein